MENKEKRSSWEFFTGPDGCWFWTVDHPDGTEAGATRGFRTLSECIEDAEQHGYAVWPREVKRRKDS